MRVWVTGASGFVGSALLAELAAKCQATGIVRPRSGPAAAFPWPALEHDWTQPWTHAAPAAPDVFVHGAIELLPSPCSAEDAARIHARNDAVARHAAQAAARLGAKRVILLSSGSVHEEQDAPITGATPLAPEANASPYALSLIRREREFTAAVPADRLRIVRLFYPYGPGQASDRLLPRLAARIARGEPVQLRPDAAGGGFGRPRINPVYVTDLARALTRLCLEQEAWPGPGTIPLGGAEALSIAELAERIARALGKSLKTQPDPAAPPARDLRCDPEPLARLLGGAHPTPLDKGLTAALAGVAGPKA